MKESTLVITSVANGYQVSDAWGDTTNASLHVFETFDALAAFLRERLPVFDGSPPGLKALVDELAGAMQPTQAPVTASEINAADPNYCELCNTSSCPLPADITGAPKF